MSHENAIAGKIPVGENIRESKKFSAKNARLPHRVKKGTGSGSGLDPDPDWIRIQSGLWNRIRIQEGKSDPQK
jgi:hypothetical protein